MDAGIPACSITETELCRRLRSRDPGQPGFDADAVEPAGEGPGEHRRAVNMSANVRGLIEPDADGETFPLLPDLEFPQRGRHIGR